MLRIPNPEAFFYSNVKVEFFVDETRSDANTKFHSWYL